jgi:hypothetical protein
MIEAMACGTPVLALRRGSVPEVVDHGVTGFVSDSLEEMVDACGRLRTLDPVDIRRRRAERFDGSVMTRGYRDVYRSVTRDHRAGRRQPDRVRTPSDPGGQSDLVRLLPPGLGYRLEVCGSTSADACVSAAQASRPTRT